MHQVQREVVDADLLPLLQPLDELLRQPAVDRREHLGQQWLTAASQVADHIVGQPGQVDEMYTLIDQFSAARDGAPRGVQLEVADEPDGLVFTNEHGEAVFEQKDLEIPKAWSQLATQVVASKYFRGHLGTPERERSAKQMIDRVADTIADWGVKDAYFATDEDADAFRNELKDILLKQRASFNSPVWFNVGIDAHPQCSACFINSVDDTMESILTLAKTEGMLFKFGSGAGSNLSTIRSSKETLRGGGEASGPARQCGTRRRERLAVRQGGTGEVLPPCAALL